MPVFRFFIHGYDPSLPGGDRGFFTVRHAFGWTCDHAAKRALKRLNGEIAAGVWDGVWQSQHLSLAIEKSSKVGISNLWSKWDAALAVYGHEPSGAPEADDG